MLLESSSNCKRPSQEVGAGPSGVKRALLAATLVTPFLFALLYLLAGPALVVEPDSGSYTSWNPIRTAIYPIFVRMVSSTDLRALQVLLLAATVAWAGWRTFCWTQSTILTALLTTGLLVNPYVWLMQGSVLSEALTTPLLILFSVSLLNFSLFRTHNYLFWLAGLAGLLAATRPVLLPLIMIPILAALTLSNKKLRLVLTCLSIALVPIGLERVVSNVRHGDRLTSLAGKHVFAKASLLNGRADHTEPRSATERRLATLMLTEYNSIRAELRRAPPGPIRDALRLNYEICIQYACTQDALAAGMPPDHVMNAAMLKVGLPRLLGDIPGYVRLSWDEYKGMWLHHSAKHPDLAKNFRDYLTSRGELPFKRSLGEAGVSVPVSEQRSIYRVTRPLFLVIGLALGSITLISVGAVLRRSQHPYLLVTLLASLSVQLTLVFASLTGVGIARYAMSLWPPMVVSLLFGLLYMLAALTRTENGKPEWFSRLTGSKLSELPLRPSPPQIS